jgi:hypothetical protein
MASPHEDYRSFLIDRDADKADEVAFAEGLDVGIVSGVQAYPPPSGAVAVGNRLLIFTGTAIFDAHGAHGNISRGIVRVRVRHALPKAVTLIGSATVAALASIHSTDEEDAVFAADGAETVLGPTVGGLLPGNGLPDDELYVIIDAAVFGEETNLQRIAYQANVLVLDQQPDFDSLLVAVDGTNSFGGSITLFSQEAWDFRLTLTGPAPGGAGDVVGFNLSSSDSSVIDIGLDGLVQIPAGATSATFRARSVGGAPGIATITATALFGKKASRTAQITVTIVR